MIIVAFCRMVNLSVSYEESIRGKQVFLIQSTFPNSDKFDGTFADD